MSTTSQLTAQQQQVLALIASGFNATTAARHAGVHRNTVTNWLKTETFREALEQARLAKQILYWDEAETLMAEVINDLRNLSHDPAVPPSIRLKAMLALLQHARSVLPGDAPLVLLKPMHNDAQLPERSDVQALAADPRPVTPAAEARHSHQPPALPMHNDAQLPERSDVQSLAPDPRPLTPAAAARPVPLAPAREARAKVGPNEPCPCGSGLKFKRCCIGKTVPSPEITAVA